MTPTALSADTATSATADNRTRLFALRPGGPAPNSSTAPRSILGRVLPVATPSSPPALGSVPGGVIPVERTPPFHGGNRGSSPLGDAIAGIAQLVEHDLAKVGVASSATADNRTRLFALRPGGPASRRAHNANGVIRRYRHFRCLRSGFKSWGFCKLTCASRGHAEIRGKFIHLVCK